MHTRTTRLLAAASLACLLATGLAGCSDGGAGGGRDDAGEGAVPGLRPGTGGVSGLLIDDRYRPLAGGLVLLQGGPENVGQTATSNANGEFTFVNLVPGTYTARATIEGHEAAPQQVQVAAGAFQEFNLEARRVVSSGGLIITEEYSVFIPCSAAVPITVATFNCVFDISGDTFRTSVSGLNYTAYNVTWVVMEFETNKAGNYLGVLGPPGIGSGGSVSDSYGYVEVDGANYGKVVAQVGVPGPGVRAFNNTGELEVALFVQGQVQEVETPPAEVPGVVGVGPGTWGVGADFGIKGHFVLSAFVGEPEVSVQDYRAIAEPQT